MRGAPGRQSCQELPVSRMLVGSPRRRKHFAKIWNIYSSIENFHSGNYRNRSADRLLLAGRPCLDFVRCHSGRLPQSGQLLMALALVLRRHPLYRGVES